VKKLKKFVKKLKKKFKTDENCDKNEKNIMIKRMKETCEK